MAMTSTIFSLTILYDAFHRDQILPFSLEVQPALLVLSVYQLLAIMNFNTSFCPETPPASSFLVKADIKNAFGTSAMPSAAISNF